MASKMVITTGDLKNGYEIIGPVFFSINNSGIFKNSLGQLIEKYISERDSRKEAFNSTKQHDWEALLSEALDGKNNLDKAYYVSVMELKAKAVSLGADAIISLQYTIEYPTPSFDHLQMSITGTAVKFIEK
jgi:hypothetical protein